jgi:dCMP deaminase
VASHEEWLLFCGAGASIFSRCSRRSYFSLVLASDGRVLGTGYNGAPAGLPNCSDGGCPRASADVAHGSPYGNCIAVHAEANALLHSDRSDRTGGTLYVNGPPCWDCSKLIAGSGIKTVVHARDMAYADWPKCQALLESGSPVWFGQEPSMDLANSTSNRSPLADVDRQWRALGFDALVIGNGSTDY